MNSLNLLGLSLKEEAIFKTILEEGFVNASELAKTSRVKRGSIYLYLESLKQKGLIVEIQKEDKRFYRSVNSKQLDKIIQQKINHLKFIKKSLAQKIQAIKFKAKNQPAQILIYQGTSGLNLLLEDIAQNKEDTYLLGSAKVFYKFMKDEPWEQRYNKKRRLKVSGTDYMITDWADKTIKAFYKESDLFLKRRFLPEDFKINGGVAIYGDKIAIGVFINEARVLVIEEPTLAHLFKHMFQLFFKELKGKNIPPQI